MVTKGYFQAMRGAHPLKCGDEFDGSVITATFYRDDIPYVQLEDGREEVVPGNIPLQFVAYSDDEVKPDHHDHEVRHKWVPSDPSEENFKCLYCDATASIEIPQVWKEEEDPVDDDDDVPLFT